MASAISDDELKQNLYKKAIWYNKTRISAVFSINTLRQLDAGAFKEYKMRNQPVGACQNNNNDRQNQ